jgi:hypothetical protein
MNSRRNKWISALVIGMAAAMLSSALYALDPGINQPGVIGGVPGGGAPGVGTRDPGINQPGAMGNVGVGAPGAGARDPGINQPGAIGNTGPARRSVRR